MCEKPNASLPERFAVFLDRLAAALPATNEQDALRIIGEVMNAVEDEMTDIPFDPSQWEVDGRMYPPQVDKRSPMAGMPGLYRYKTRRHWVIISDRGDVAIVHSVTKQTIFSAPGKDETEGGGE